MIIAKEQPIAECATQGLGLLYLLGALGSGDHKLVLIAWENGRIVEAADYSPAMTEAMIQEMDRTGLRLFKDNDLTAVARSHRLNTVISSNGEMAIEFIKIGVTLRRDSSGTWAVLEKELPPVKTNVDTTAVTSSSTALAYAS